MICVCLKEDFLSFSFGASFPERGSPGLPVSGKHPKKKKGKKSTRAHQRHAHVVHVSLLVLSSVLVNNSQM